MFVIISTIRLFCTCVADSSQDRLANAANWLMEAINTAEDRSPARKAL